MAPKQSIWERLAREIVVQRAAVVLLVGAFVHLLVVKGVLHASDADVQLWTGRAVDGLAVLIGVIWARSGVTPADPALGPTSSDGQPLIAARSVPLADIRADAPTGNVRRVEPPG